MAVIANVTLVDAEATPVSHVFEPAKTTSDFAMWENRASGSYIGYEKLAVTLVRPKGQSNVANRSLKVVYRIEAPVLENLGTSDSGLTALPTVAYRPFVEMTFNLPERSTLQQRKNLLGLAYTALGLAALGDVVRFHTVPY